MINGADLPGDDKMQLGQAFVRDVLGEGDGTALMSALTSAGAGAGGTASLFSGGAASPARTAAPTRSRSATAALPAARP